MSVVSAILLFLIFLTLIDVQKDLRYLCNMLENNEDQQELEEEENEDQ